MGAETKATARAGTVAEIEHVDGALDFDCTTERERLLNRMCIDGGHTAAFALRALKAESPTLADPILKHFARYTDEIDDLLVSLGDAAARRVA